MAFQVMEFGLTHSGKEGRRESYAVLFLVQAETSATFLADDGWPEWVFALSTTGGIFQH